MQHHTASMHEESITSPTGARLALRHSPASGAAAGVVQINHGLAEHSGRYARFAAALNGAGFHAYAHDHRGHGATTAPDARPRLFAAQGGAGKVIADVDAVHDLIATRHPGLPVITFGHSMGGLIALNHAVAHPLRSAGVAVWNANFSAGLLGRIGQMLLAWERFRLGHDVASRIVPKLTFQAWAKSVANRRTDFDWLSRDPAEVDAYVDDPLCGWDASVAMWQDVFRLVFTGADDVQLRRLPRGLPLHIRGGGRDPATDFAKATHSLAKRCGAIGFTDVTLAIDPEGCHESLNDINKDAVTAEFIGWATRVCGQWRGA
ncbi:MAG: alpha/beta hydrolase [Rhizobiaceae bacterium]|jgi:alpha-beta hydrolase superfamily lysophospholipase|nr:alpha/beta hydrolase [Rhizobiaceae bacterium]